ncbi:MAG: M1 family metallopeptidase [Myxococcota bacterium]
MRAKQLCSWRSGAAAAIAWASIGLGCRGEPSQPTWPTASPPAVEQPPGFAPADARDIHSFAEPTEVVTTHLGLSWQLDFEHRTLSGHATHALRRDVPDAPLRLDTRGLSVDRVEASAAPVPEVPRLAELGDDAAWTEAEFSWGRDDTILGRELVVALPKDATMVRVHYRVPSTASGLQWLEAAQTSGEHPFVYSQSQAIHARSFIPCQDSPGVRVTYDAVVQTDRPLVVAMAGRRVDAAGAEAPPEAVPNDGQHRFDMRQPIPAYLLAVAAGDLRFKPLSSRTGVWAEPAVLDKAAAEFADMEAMLRTAETLYGPYRWERYDVLVLPPAFPFGGMENPRLTFATPTILAGDRSLVSLIAHELAHSWSGNLVTNATWGDMWLNEGFTVYIERRIVEALYGEARTDMEAVLGYQDLQDELSRVAGADERLAVSLEGRDPDDGLTDVPYEKGALFLGQLERAYGREVFDPFLRAWFDGNAFTSVRTTAFEAHLRQSLLEVAQPRPGASIVDPDAWIHAAGVPSDATLPSSDAFVGVDEQVAAFTEGTTAAADLPGASWSVYEWLHFLRHLPEGMTAERFAELDAAYRLTAATNYEVLAQWLDTSVRHGYRVVDERLERFLIEVGRRKFLVPLYEALLDAGRTPDAKRIYARARSGYHAVTRSTLDALLGAP